MTKFQLSLSSSTYKNQIFDGFSRLQQSDEFVDMTLAAEGHLVKVHQTLVALASPYLKDMLLSVPCQHPVIFLNGISHEMLGFILEYIYRGEVEIPAEKVQTFLYSAQAMHIAGLKNIIPPDEDEQSRQEMHTKHVFHKPEPPAPAVKASITIQDDNNFDLQLQQPLIEIPDIETENQTNNQIPFGINIPMTPEGNDEFQNVGNMTTCGKSINISLDNSVINDNLNQKPVAKIEILGNTLINENIDAMNDQGQLPQLYTDALAKMKKEIKVNNLLKTIGDELPIQLCNPKSGPTGSSNIEDLNETDRETDSVLYTASTRGALQLIMNRFMYYCHYRRDNGRKRRWRCIDYRGAHCPASIDTVGEQVVNRKHKHCHPNHDQKIRKKIARSETQVFSTVQMAQNILEKQKSDT